MKRIEWSSAIARVGSAWPLLAPVALLLTILAFGVEPQLRAARAAHAQTAALHDRLAALQSAAGATSGSGTAEPAVQEFDLRTPEDDRVSDVLHALAQLALAPAASRVEGLTIETGDQNADAGGQTVDPRFTLFRSPIGYAPVTVSFDATYPRLGGFFWNLRILPTTWDLRSVDISQSPGSSLLHAKVILAALHRVGGADRAAAPEPQVVRIAAPPAVDLAVSPQWPRDPFQAVLPLIAAAAPPPDPIVQTILYSPLRSTAIVDGRIVTVGDRVSSGSIAAIEPDAVIIGSAAGPRKRIALKPPALKGTIDRKSVV